jgi:hypothetical protein
MRCGPEHEEGAAPGRRRRGERLRVHHMIRDKPACTGSVTAKRR